MEEEKYNMVFDLENYSEDDIKVIREFKTFSWVSESSDFIGR